MKWLQLLCVAAAIATLQWKSDAAPDDSTGGQPLLAGAAQVDITPPVGYRMAGYFDERVSTGMHDPLRAKAIVFRQGQRRFAWVFCDLLGVTLGVTKPARQEASKATGIPVGNIMVCATHSHTGPLFDDVRRDYFHDKAITETGTDPRERIYYPEFLQRRIVEVITEANASLVPVQLTVARDRLDGIAFNRRYHMTNGTVQTNPGLLNPGIVNPAGPVDPDVTALLIQRAIGNRETVAAISVFSCHCDTCGGAEFSSDYPYYLSEALKRSLGPKAVTAFGAAPCGDINHINVQRTHGLKGFANSERIGTNIARVVLNAPKKTVRQPSLDSRAKTVFLPLQKVTPEQVASAKLELNSIADPKVPMLRKVRTLRVLDLDKRGADWPVEVQVFRLNKDTAIVCLPGEIFVELGLAIKRGSPFSNTIVLSICNDRPGYVPTQKAFAEGSYEVENSRLVAGSGERMVQMALEMLREMSAPEAAK